MTGRSFKTFDIAKFFIILMKSATMGGGNPPKPQVDMKNGKRGFNFSGFRGFKGVYGG